MQIESLSVLDLHTHSSYSDGTWTPEQIYQKAVDLGLTGIALTDHDTVEGALKFAGSLTHQQQEHCKFIVGTEISSQWEGESIHILAYGCEWSSQFFHNFLQNQLQLRLDRMTLFLDRLLQKNIANISLEQLKIFAQRGTSNTLNQESNSVQMIGRLHLAKLLIHLGKARDLTEVFGRLIGKRGIAYVPSNYPYPYEVIDMIHRAGGIAVLAHPQLVTKKMLRRDVLGYNWDGLEAIYGNRGRFCPQHWVDLAHKHRLLVTAGSDFHTQAERAPFIGASTLQGDLMHQFLERLQSTNTGAVPAELISCNVPKL